MKCQAHILVGKHLEYGAQSSKSQRSVARGILQASSDVLLFEVKNEAFRQMGIESFIAGQRRRYPLDKISYRPQMKAGHI